MKSVVYWDNSLMIWIYIYWVKNKLTKQSTQYLHSGFKISYNKASFYCIGSLSQSQAKKYSVSIKWMAADLKILGVIVSRDLESLTYKNYNGIIDKAASVLNTWMQFIFERQNANYKFAYCFFVHIQNACSTNNFIYNSQTI